jgi:hypothetical protein
MGALFFAQALLVMVMRSAIRALASCRRWASSIQLRTQACMYSVGRYSLCGVRNTGSAAANSGEPPLPQNPTSTLDSASRRMAASVMEVPLPNSNRAVLRSGRLKYCSTSSPLSVSQTMRSSFWSTLACSR